MIVDLTVDLRDHARSGTSLKTSIPRRAAADELSIGRARNRFFASETALAHNRVRASLGRSLVSEGAC